LLKTLPYILLLALLGAGVWYFFARPEGETFDPKEAGFAVTDTASIHRIFIADRSGQRITVQRAAQGGQWLIEGKDPVLPAQINQLLATLHNQKTVYPVPAKMHNAVVKGMAASSRKVELFDRSGKLIRAFYVGGETPDFNGTYMLMEGAKRPYVIRLAQFEGYLQPRYSTSWYDWRDRIVFNVPADSVKRVAVTYAEDTRRSFAIERTGSGVQVTTEGAAPGAANSNRAIQYLGFFQNIYSEGFLNGRRGMRENLAVVPKMCDIEVTTPGGTQRVEVYWRLIDKRSKNIDDNIYDPDRFYALLNGGRDTVGIQQQTFERILRDGREFFVGDSTLKSGR
jgi:hypothetical protein